MPGRTATEGTPAREDFTGHELDRATQLHYAGARYYLSAYGRWNATEPLLDEELPAKLLEDGKGEALATSPYNYSLNDPVNLVDRNGEWPTPWDIADFGFAALSIRDAWNDPSAGNIGWAVADVTTAALPVVPSTGYLRGGIKAARTLDKSSDVASAYRKLEDAVNSVDNVADLKALGSKTDELTKVEGDNILLNAGSRNQVFENLAEGAGKVKRRSDGSATAWLDDGTRVTKYNTDSGFTIRVDYGPQKADKFRFIME